MNEPKIFTTQEWGATFVNTHILNHRKAAGCVIHHTADSPRHVPANANDEHAQAFLLARRIQRYHRDKKHWIDSGQHFTVSRGGVLMEGRTRSLELAREGRVLYGAHAGVTAINGTYFGIECEGNTNEAPLTDAQWKALVDLVAWLAHWGNFDTQNLFPHNKYRPTACPGEWLLERLPELRRAAHDLKVAIREAHE